MTKGELGCCLQGRFWRNFREKKWGIKRRSHKMIFFLLLLSSSLVEFVTGGLPGSFRSWTWREGCNSTPLLREPVEPRGFSTSFHSFSFFSFLFFLLSSRPCSGHYLRTLLLILGKGPWRQGSGGESVGWLRACCCVSSSSTSWSHSQWGTCTWGSHHIAPPPPHTCCLMLCVLLLGQDQTRKEKKDHAL